MEIDMASKTINISPLSGNTLLRDWWSTFNGEVYLSIKSKDAEPHTGSLYTTVQIGAQSYSRWGNVTLTFKMVYPAVSKVVTLTVAEVS